MSVPFYADAEKLSSKGSNFNRVWIYILGLVWIVALGYFFSFVETQDSLLLKSLGIIAIAGIPVCVILKVKSDVWKHGNQNLQKLYEKHMAHQSIVYFFGLIIWQLLGRWIFEDIHFEKLGLIIFPFFLIMTVYQGVYKDVKEIVEPSD